jgi:S-(hydroxymethyl)glutathione dehydrogenase/alcohol dehydrogenase
MYKTNAYAAASATSALASTTISRRDPGEHDVQIEILFCGVCHSDLHYLEGSYPTPLPTVLGHESAGIVEAVGADVRTVAVGDHVVTCLSAFCGHCEHCLTGHLSLCKEPETQRAEDEAPRLGSNGAPMAQFLNLSAFAECMLVHEHACVAISPDMPLDRAALIGCAALTGYGAVVRTAALKAVNGRENTRRHESTGAKAIPTRIVEKKMMIHVCLDCSSAPTGG